MVKTINTQTRQARRALFRISHIPHGQRQYEGTHPELARRRVPAGVAARTVKALLADRLVETVGEWMPPRGSRLALMRFHAVRHIQVTGSGKRRASEVESTMGGPWWNPGGLRAAKIPRAKPQPFVPRGPVVDNVGRDRERARRVDQMQARAGAVT